MITGRQVTLISSFLSLFWNILDLEILAAICKSKSDTFLSFRKHSETAVLVVLAVLTTLNANMRWSRQSQLNDVNKIEINHEILTSRDLMVKF